MVNRLGTYGTPQKIRIHKDEQIKYPTEVAAAGHIYDPLDARFTPAPARDSEIWCPGCHKLKKPDMFHRSRNRPRGRHPYCKACRKAGIEKPHKKHKALGHWYRL